jgi:hypothetical protein
VYVCIQKKSSCLFLNLQFCRDRAAAESCEKERQAAEIIESGNNKLKGDIFYNEIAANALFDNYE